MGQSNSISQKSYQDTENQITQISNETCTTTCFSDISVPIHITDSSGIKVSVSSGCYVTGASCTLKASLNNSLTNTQKDQEKSEIKAGSDPFPVINFGSNDINQSNYQKIGNNVTQDLNSVCKNSAESIINKPITLNDDKNDDVTEDSKAKMTNPKCIVTNAASSKVTNSQSNTMSATIVGVDCLSAIMNSVGIIVIVGGFVAAAKIAGSTDVKIALAKSSSGPKTEIFEMKDLSKKPNIAEEKV